MGKKTHGKLNLDPERLGIRIAYAWVPVDCSLLLLFCWFQKRILSEVLHGDIKEDLLQNALRLLNTHANALMVIPNDTNFVFYEMNTKKTSQL